MTEQLKLQLIRELAMTKLMETRIMAGSDVHVPQASSLPEAFIEGEHSLANEILAIINE